MCTYYGYNEQICDQQTTSKLYYLSLIYKLNLLQHVATLVYRQILWIRLKEYGGTWRNLNIFCRKLRTKINWRCVIIIYWKCFLTVSKHVKIFPLINTKSFESFELNFFPLLLLLILTYHFSEMNQSTTKCEFL